MKGNRCYCLVFLVLIAGLFLLPPMEEKEMGSLHRFVDLEINSSKKPQNTHLWWEDSNGYLYALDSADNNDVIKSEDKGASWSKIADLTGGANGFAMFPDEANDRLYISGMLAGTDLKRDYITLSNDTLTNLGTLIATNINVRDVFVYGASSYHLYSWGAVPRKLSFFKETTLGIETQDMGNDAARTHDFSQVAVVGGFAWYLWKWSDENVELWKYEIDNNAFTEMEDCGANTELPPINQRAITYDGSNILQFVLQDTGDSKFYLYTYNITGDTLTKGAEFNVALMLDRNNVGIDPNPLEKGFGITDKKVYEIKANRGGIVQLQTISLQQNYNIIAITDNFLMLDNDPDFPMFEFQDVMEKLTSISYPDGIIGIRKKGTFTLHPDFSILFARGDSIKIYDQYDQLEFWGIIKTKNQNSRGGMFVFTIDSFTNEIYDVPYEKEYSADDTDAKQKDIIDNAFDFNYRDSSIVATATTYDYLYNRAAVYMFWLARRLERQVPYIEPDGKVWTKLYSALSPNALIYPGLYSFKDVAVGTQGTSIDWVDTVNSADDHEIIAELKGHRKVLRTYRNSGSGDSRHNFPSQSTAGWIEFWTEVADANALNRIADLFEDANVRIRVNIDNDRFEYDAGAGRVAAGVAAVDNTLYHVYLQWYADNTFDLWVDGTQYLDGASTFANFTGSGMNIWRFAQDTAGAKYMYLDSPQSSLDLDPAYTKGDNEVAWDLANHWQDTFFVDIPGIEEVVQGFFDGNTGITRNTIRYMNNATTIRPIAATRDPIEQLTGIIPMKEFRDPKLEASTEADQLGDNRYAIWAADTKYIGLRVAGQGYLQPGKTIHIENTNSSRTLAESNLLLLSFLRDPKNDVYHRMILTDNIIFPSEFSRIGDTSRLQAHTASVQALENQYDINLHLTKEGGLALRLTNETGAASIKGTLVTADAAVDNAFDIAPGNSVEAFGAVYEDGVADGSECLVCIGGRVQVLLKDATAATRGNWAEMSDVAGRADITGATPAAAPQHFQEIGHGIENKGADTDVLAFIIMHFL